MRLGLVEQVELLQQPLVLLVVHLTQVPDIPPPAADPDKIKSKGWQVKPTLTGESEHVWLAGSCTGRDRRGAAGCF